MEITIKINGHMVSVEVSNEVAECYVQGRRKAENLSHEKRRHWGVWATRLSLPPPTGAANG